MQHMVVIGETDKLAARAKYMHMATTAQRTRRIWGGNIHRIQILHFCLRSYHPTPMMEVVMPCFIRIFRPMNKHIFFQLWMNGHHANVRSLHGPINHLQLASMNIDALNCVAGKRGTGRAHIKDQPLAVRCPGIDIGKLMITRRKGDLLHGMP